MLKIYRKYMFKHSSKSASQSIIKWLNSNSFKFSMFRMQGLRKSLHNIWRHLNVSVVLCIEVIYINVNMFFLKYNRL